VTWNAKIRQKPNLIMEGSYYESLITEPSLLQNEDKSRTGKTKNSGSINK
jgi:hypothetical protein